MWRSPEIATQVADTPKESSTEESLMDANTLVKEEKETEAKYPVVSTFRFGFPNPPPPVANEIASATKENSPEE